MFDVAEAGDRETLEPLIKKYGAAIISPNNPLGDFISHPFYHNPLSSSFAKAMRVQIIRGRLAKRKMEREPSLDNIMYYLFGNVERPYRFNELKEVMHNYEYLLTVEERRDVLVSLWIDTEIFDADYADEWLEFLTEYRSDLIDTLVSIPSEGELITLYHGVEYDMDADDYNAYAWTTDIEVAKKFAGRFADTPRGLFDVTLTIEQIFELALFYTDERGESEVLFHTDPRESNV